MCEFLSFATPKWRKKAFPAASFYANVESKFENEIVCRVEIPRLLPLPSFFATHNSLASWLPLLFHSYAKRGGRLDEKNPSFFPPDRLKLPVFPFSYHQPCLFLSSRSALVLPCGMRRPCIFAVMLFPLNTPNLALGAPHTLSYQVRIKVGQFIIPWFSTGKEKA